MSNVIAMQIPAIAAPTMATEGSRLVIDQLLPIDAHYQNFLLKLPSKMPFDNATCKKAALTQQDKGPAPAAVKLSRKRYIDQNPILINAAR
ncbi:hypothetical protein OSJ78_09770 [Mycobacterium ulcerans]